MLSDVQCFFYFINGIHYIWLFQSLFIFSPLVFFFFYFGFIQYRPFKTFFILALIVFLIVFNLFDYLFALFKVLYFFSFLNLSYNIFPFSIWFHGTCICSILSCNLVSIPITMIASAGVPWRRWTKSKNEINSILM